jgi:hypothetical protein
MDRKASAFLIGFIILLVIAVFFMVSLQMNTDVTKMLSADTDQTYDSYLGGYGELLKKFSFHTLRNAATKASFEEAKTGGGKFMWRDKNCPDTPPFERTKISLETTTIADFNKYIKDAEGYDYSFIQNQDVGEISLANAWVYEAGVNNGVYDEKFNISGKSIVSNGLNIIQSPNKDETRSFLHDYTTYVYPVRFWYMWRIFQEWVNQNEIPATTCVAIWHTFLDDPPHCPAVDPIINSAVSHLQSMFDEYVTCEYELIFVDCKAPRYIEYEYYVWCTDTKYKSPVNPDYWENLVFKEKESIKMTLACECVR